MLDEATSKAVAECVARINPKLMEGEGAVFTQNGLESLLQINHAFALKMIRHLCENLHVYEDLVQDLNLYSKLKERA
tara:strand:+ start:549 stop:779 length:231 start_codon:yes stop_codon:yes gene_type:complete